MFRVFVFALAILFTGSLAARPVSYPGGWTVMSMNDGDRYSGHIHYSPSAFYSVGYKGEYWREFDFQIHALQLNNLLKRWNKRHSQANLYLKTGAGITSSDLTGDVDPVAFATIAADWETRRYFLSYENRVCPLGFCCQAPMNFVSQNIRIILFQPTQGSRRPDCSSYPYPLWLGRCPGQTG